MAISYLSEDSDAEEVKGLLEAARRRAVLIRGDLSKPQHCRDIVTTTMEELGGWTYWSTTQPSQ